MPKYFAVTYLNKLLFNFLFHEFQPLLSKNKDLFCGIDYFYFGLSQTRHHNSQNFTITEVTLVPNKSLHRVNKTINKITKCRKKYNRSTINKIEHLSLKF